MTTLDFDASLKHVFIGLHVLFIGGAAFYIQAGMNNFATFFGISSVLALGYYLLFQNKAMLTRMQAHVNLLHQAIEKEGFDTSGTEKEEKPGLDEVLEDKTVEEAKEFIDQQLEQEENRKGFLKAVKEAEAEGKDRVNVKYYANEKLLQLQEEE